MTPREIVLGLLVGLAGIAGLIGLTEFADTLSGDAPEARSTCLSRAS